MDGSYEAIEAIGKLKFPYSKSDVLLAFALELSNIPDLKNIYIELNALRPDIRDNKEFLIESMSYSGAKVIVLFETVKYTDVYVKNPKLIIYKSISFKNIR